LHCFCIYPAWENESGIEQNVHKSKAVMVTFLEHCNHDKEWTTIYMTVTKTVPPMLEAGCNLGFKWRKTDTVSKQYFLKGLNVLLLSITTFLTYHIQKSKFVEVF
jgi:hypothetical protein